VTVANLYGTGKHTVSRGDIPGSSVLYSLMSVSADGEMVCVGAGGQGGDSARFLYCNTVIDVVKRRVVELPVTGEVSVVLFQPDGGMLVRVVEDDVSYLILLDKNRQVVARTIETAETSELDLLSYTPPE
jgi:TolB protein